MRGRVDICVKTMYKMGETYMGMIVVIVVFIFMGTVVVMFIFMSIVIVLVFMCVVFIVVVMELWM